MSLRKSLLPLNPSNGVPPPDAQLPRVGSSDSQPQDAPSSAPFGAPPPKDSDESGGAGAPTLPASVSLSDADLGRSFRPTEAMARAKAKYWATLADRPLVGGAAHTLALAKQVTQSGSLDGWWRKPGFKDWFLNERTTEERLEWLAELSMSALESILLNDDPKVQSARLNAAKLVAEMTGRSKRGADADPDAKKRAAIDAMSKEDLTKLLESQGIRVEHSVSIPVEKKD